MRLSTDNPADDAIDSIDEVEFVLENINTDEEIETLNHELKRAKEFALDAGREIERLRDELE